MSRKDKRVFAKSMLAIRMLVRRKFITPEVAAEWRAMIKWKYGVKQ